MPRYVDANKIDYTVRSFYDGYSIEGEIILEARAVAFESDIDQMPTADVVPRSEVERLEAELEDKQFRCDSCDRIALTSSEHRFCVSQAKQDVAREIFAELEQTVMHPNWASQTYKEWYFAELKKKYIGE